MTYKTQLLQLKELLWKSKRPLFHIGNGARHGEETFFRFIEALQVPFITARNANDIVAWEHPLYLGRPGTFAQRGANFAVQTCDLYIAVGTRLSLTQTGYNTKDYARNAQIVQVNIDKAELEKGTLRNPINICMDAKVFLEEFEKLWHEPTEWIQWSVWTRWAQWDPWLKQCQEWKKRYPICLPTYWAERDHVNSYVLVDVLSENATSNDIIVTDMGFAFQNTHQGWKTKKGQRILTNCGLAPMGWGLPAALGAGLASGKRVILITGDGGLMMNVQEMATAAHHNLPIKMFLLNNGGYLTIRQTQQLGFEGRLMGVDEDTGLSFPNFKLLADSFKWKFFRLENHVLIKNKVRTRLEHPGPVFVEVAMDPEQAQAPRSVNRRNPDGTMNPTKLEDSYPFLDPEEVVEQMRIAE